MYETFLNVLFKIYILFNIFWMVSYVIVVTYLIYFLFLRTHIKCLDLNIFTVS